MDDKRRISLMGGEGRGDGVSERDGSAQPLKDDDALADSLTLKRGCVALVFVISLQGLSTHARFFARNVFLFFEF